jgi:hypothetical protein
LPADAAVARVPSGHDALAARAPALRRNSGEDFPAWLTSEIKGMIEIRLCFGGYAERINISINLNPGLIYGLQTPKMAAPLRND